MEPPPGCSREDRGYHSPGVDELREELHDTKPTVSSVIVTAGDFAEDLRSEAEQGAAAEHSRVGAGAPGPMDDEHQKVGGGSEESGRQQQQQEPAHAATEGPQPQDPQQRLHCCTCTRLELKELESIFQRTQYPDVFARKELARIIDVPEAKVQVSKPEK